MKEISEYKCKCNEKEYLIKVGDKYNRLTIERIYQDEEDSKWYSECICECGTKCNHILIRSLLTGNTKSCGCYNSDLVSQRNTKPTKNPEVVRKIKGRAVRLYRIWSDMRRRCNNPNRPTSKNYYEKGIRVCDEWDDYENFWNWAWENGYDDTLTIERKDCSKGYSPENCCWIPKAEQAKNRDSFCHYIYYEGERYTLTDFAKKLGIKRTTLSSCFVRGWSMEKNLRAPWKKI